MVVALDLTSSLDGDDLAAPCPDEATSPVLRPPSTAAGRAGQADDAEPVRFPVLFEGVLDRDGCMQEAGDALPDRDDLRAIMGRVDVIIFDFDGTLTATPGDRQVRSRKSVEICERAGLLRPRLQALREAGCMLGVMSKSTQATVRDALAAGGIDALFDAPVVGKALGFEGK
eukprot:CAMPEP_0170206678 /NCGR_PEP_ID=MMETSP0116_2-20130129/2905_1 /TAXON_ID=400756 /ORGANISM="Durinskia baltica, Strain CSIRO CS-38" /LENGTH=171 /DNA_ID=CAMNT_0010457113 /DNA_START=19 /DNA_END=533 /DNA_ORIENTATION=-